MTNKYIETANGFAVQIRENDWGAGKSHTITGVQVDIVSSTSTARAMNIALKVLALPWTDTTIETVERLLDARLVEIANK
jgi:hypothetical protein